MNLSPESSGSNNRTALEKLQSFSNSLEKILSGNLDAMKNHLTEQVHNFSTVLKCYISENRKTRDRQSALDFDRKTIFHKPVKPIDIEQLEKDLTPSLDIFKKLLYEYKARGGVIIHRDTELSKNDIPDLPFPSIQDLSFAMIQPLESPAPLPAPIVTSPSV